MSVVRKLLAKLNERKAAGLDNIPSRLLKMAGNIIAPSLTPIFIKSINTGIFPTEWKLARVTLFFWGGGRGGGIITNRLSLNIAKTEFMVIGSNQRIHALSKNQIDIEIDGKSIKKSKKLNH